MDTFFQEVDSNFDSFFDSFEQSIVDALEELVADRDIFKSSYHRLLSLQAWKGLSESLGISNSVIGFVLEAQNDGISSHLLARQGSWRPALMCLRSLIENTLSFVYYKDHPVEFELWKSGLHRMQFTQLVNYLEAHPNARKLDQKHMGIDNLKSEYSTLSKAVHSSNLLFRMTKTGRVQGLNNPSSEELGKWATRERCVIRSINMLMLVIFSDHLKGAANKDLRKVVSVSLKPSSYPFFKQNFGIILREQILA